LPVLDARLDRLDGVWNAAMEARYATYADAAAGLPQAQRESVAMAATLVETAVALHELGSGVAMPGDLLLGDLCLARASRLLAESAGQELQLAFADVVAEAAAAAAAGEHLPAIGERLVSILEARR
jgi:hypothetical protein